MTTSPTVQRRRLAHELRRLREANLRTRTDVCREIGWSPAKLSTMENGLVGVKTQDLAILLDSYHVSVEAERERLQDMARAAGRRGWWHKYRDVLSEEYATYIGLESEACAVHTYQPAIVPGLLQTAAYAREVFRTAIPEQPQEALERRVSVRLARQARLFEADPIQVWAVLEPAVLDIVIGGRLDVMREQFDWLLRLHELPNVHIQLLRRGHSGHPALRGQFDILEFPELTHPDVVYVDSLAGERYVEEAGEVHRARLIMDRLRTEAIVPRQALTHLKIARDR